jgi:probable rRNA maturation factor
MRRNAMEILFINKSREKGWNNYRRYLNIIVLKSVETLNIDTQLALSLILIDDDAMHRMNKEYRGVDGSTDVISFAAEEGEADFVASDIRELGDVFINVDAIRSQAADYGHSLKREFCFLFTHGLLHLLGYDHMHDADEKEMNSLQESILNEIAKR